MAEPQEDTELLLVSGAGRRRSAPGRGFKSKIDGCWKDYSPHCNRLLLEVYTAGCPSMRLCVNGIVHKFDFMKMEQKNLSTSEVHQLRAPHDVQRTSRFSFFKMDNFRHPLSKGRRQRPVFVVHVPAGSPDTTIHVPHPKKWGKSMAVAVPRDAQVGQPLFLPMPHTQLNTKIKYATGGAAVGTTGAAVGFAVGGAHAGVAAAGSAIATVGTVAAIGIGGVAVAGAVVAAGVGVHYATRNPRKAVVIGALTIGGLALASHVADVGVTEAAADAAELMEGGLEMAEDIGEACLDAEDWLGDFAEDGGDILMDLF